MIKNDKGFSIIEVVIAMTLFGMVLIAGYQFLFSGIKSWTHGEEQIDVVQNMRVGMDFMTREIRSATRVKTIDDSNIVITVPKADFSSAVDIKYHYDSTGKELEREEGGNGLQPVSSNISGLTFSYEPENPKKWVGIEMKGRIKDKKEITIKSKVTLRSVR